MTLVLFGGYAAGFRIDWGLWAMFAKDLSGNSHVCQFHCGPEHAGPKEKLNSTVISQPAIYVASLAALEKLRLDKGEVWFMTHHITHLVLLIRFQSELFPILFIARDLPMI